jgi:hypothetical protein
LLPSVRLPVKSLDSLAPDVLAALRAQAERDLARRIVFGAMVYCAMVVIVAWGTGYHRDHPGTIVTFGTLTFFLGAGRLAAALRMRHEAGPALFRWGAPLRRFTEIQLAVWGAFAWWTLTLYGFEPVSLLILLSTAAFSGGITSSLCPDLALARRGLLLIMLPPTMWGVFQGTRQGWVLVAFGTIYLAFLLMQVGEHIGPTGPPVSPQPRRPPQSGTGCSGSPLKQPMQAWRSSTRRAASVESIGGCAACSATPKTTCSA